MGVIFGGVAAENNTQKTHRSLSRTDVIYLAGEQLRGMMFWVPQPGGLALGVSIISYDGNVVMAIASDVGLIPEPEEIITGFHEEFEAMKQMIA